MSYKAGVSKNCTCTEAEGQCLPCAQEVLAAALAAAGAAALESLASARAFYASGTLAAARAGFYKAGGKRPAWHVAK